VIQGGPGLVYPCDVKATGLTLLRLDGVALFGKETEHPPQQLHSYLLQMCGRIQ